MSKAIKQSNEPKRKTMQVKNFDVAQHELDSTIQSERHNHDLRRKILRDLEIRHEPAIIVPAGNKHAVRVNADHGHHSPYLLDLRAKKEKQAQHEIKKQEIDKFIKTHKPSVAKTATNKPTTSRKEKQHIRSKAFSSSKAQQPAAKRYDDQFTNEWNSISATLSGLAPKFAIAAIAFCVIVVLPFYGSAYYRDMKATKSGLSALSQDTANEFTAAVNSLLGNSADAAKSQFLSASNKLLQMDEKLNDINLLVTTLSGALGNEKYSIKSAKLLVDASENLSLIGIHASKAINDFYALTKNQSLTQKIEFIKTKTSIILPLLKEANENLTDVSPDFVAATTDAAKFAELRANLQSAETILTDFNIAADSLIDALGKQHKKRYLVAFQNNNELRATGGFIGSFALVEIDNGKIKNIRIPSGGSYDLQGGLTENIAAPQPLRLINPKFEFQDANWFPDFPASAQKLAWFMEKSNWPTVDGVIAINATWAAKLVDFIGPISLPEQGRTFTGENFVDALQEITLDKNNKDAPKRIIGDLTEKLLETLPNLNEQKFIPLLNLIKTGLNEKDILPYSSDLTLQNILKKYGWNGELKNAETDYLQITNSNIGGGKSDAAMEQKVELDIEINSRGEIINTLKITRRNAGRPSDPFVNENNVDFLRVYVPEGSKLLSVSGDFEPPTPDQFEQAEPSWKTDSLINAFERKQYIDPTTQTITSKEFGKTVFANWLQTKPGETTTATFKYKLPTKLSFEQKELNFFERQYKTSSTNSAKYSLLLQKQPGQQNNLLSVTINVPLAMKILHGDANGNTYKTTLNVDELLTWELSK